MSADGGRVGSLAAPWSLREAAAEAAGLERARDRIAETDAEVLAWVALDEAVLGGRSAVATADGPVDADRSGPLAGVPFGVKDIIDLRGLPTRCGSELRTGTPPAAASAAIVDLWAATGAVPVGKTVTTEFAYFAPGPTTNPAAPGHTPGGSSSGSAAAVAAGQVPLALGSQTAASVTRPASFCGVASLVVTRGRFPLDGVVGLSPSLDSHGFFTATVSDLALAWAALSGEPDATPATRAPRILLWRGSDFEVLEPDMAVAVARAARSAADAGAQVSDLDEESESLARRLVDAHGTVMAYEAVRERAAEHAVGHRLSPQLAGLLDQGAATPREEYEAALGIVEQGREAVLGLLSGVDLILGPAAPGAPPEGLGATGNPSMSRPWQALGLPTIAIPGLRDPDGLPLGVQAVGRPDAETDLLSSARWLEDLLNDPTTRRGERAAGPTDERA